ncbi:unnamed protein product [Acanthoscelides obtectus]|uniref:Uncharacterized protein n=1 Tax=Acanthoscelides obtectus TaxID=200917 RepID=A0A9P0P749_ACAOB|nr:unnamed protein product [Acanthoscelides obtectus]CAK1622842.1 hypothetical protein AOBTE_LOCUS1694 [Acanthoscelides obtectus]
MLPRLIFVVALAVIFCGVVFGAPKPFKSEKDFENAIVQFLSQDIEFLNTLEKAAMIEPHSFRHRRQAEVDSMDIDNTTDEVDQQGGDGFFDRAAKFVVDLLQRFLKWINSSDN